MIAEIVAKAGPRALTPDVPEEERKVLAANQSFRSAATNEARQQQVDMIREQEAVAKANQSVEHKAVNGLGTKVGSVTPRIWLSMMQKFGNDCWDNPDFVNWFLREEPACRVTTSRGTRGQQYIQPSR